MALDPARRRRYLPTGDLKPEFESPPGYQQLCLYLFTARRSTCTRCSSWPSHNVPNSHGRILVSGVLIYWIAIPQT